MIDWKSQRVLMSGASGFIGSALCQKLMELGCSDVNGIYRASNAKVELRKYGQSVLWHSYDGTIDSVKSMFLKCKPTLVVHLAAKTVVQHKAEDIDDLLDVSLRLPSFLAEYASGLEKCCFINTGSFWTHYLTPAYRPVNLYAATKQAFEDLLEYYLDATSLTGTTLVLPDTYGLGDTRTKLIPYLFKQLHSKEQIFLSPGQQKIDLLHKDDVTSAFILVAERLLRREAVGRKYRLTSGRLLSIRELVQEIEALSGSVFNANWGASAYRERELMEPYGSEEILPHWQANISLQDGVKAMLMTSPSNASPS